MDSNTAAIAERFSALTADKKAEFLTTLKSRGIDFGRLPIPARKKGGSGPLSYAQARQWFLWQLDPASTAYHISAGLTLQGRLDTDVLRASFETLLRRHESLRTVFHASDTDSVTQVVLPPTHLDIPLVDLSDVSSEAREARVVEEARRFTSTPFALASGPLLRVGVIRLAVEEHVLIVVMHHIVSDGSSMQILVDEFAELYRAKCAGRNPQLKPVPIQYADYAVWQRDWLAAGEEERQLAYWRAQLGHDHPVLQLPTDHPRTPEAAYRAAHHPFELPASLTRALQKRAREHRTTLFTVLLASFQSLLYRYTGQRDIRVGMPNANRNRPETQGVMGFFVNTQVLRSQIDGAMTLAALLDQVRAATVGAQEHQDLPFERLVEALQPERSFSHPPLFQVMMNHQHRDYRGLAQLPGLRLQRYALGEQRAQFELMLNTMERPDGRVTASVTYAAELFSAGTIEQLARHYLEMLRAFAQRPDQAVRNVPLLDEEDRRRLRQWSVNAHSYPSAEPVYLVIERQVERSPDTTALVVGDVELSYRELNRRANQLAHRLISLGVRPESRVGVSMERSVEMVVALLGIMKAGGAYVPLDPEYPKERLDYMMRDSRIELLLTQASIAAFNLDAESEANPQVALHPESPAYVIYTSGSTGRPKGAVNRHRSLYNRLAWMQDAYALTEVDTVLQKTPFSFDVSVWEFFWPLMYGARLVMAAPGAHRDPEQLVAVIRQQRVSTLHFVPSMLNAFLEHDGIEACTSLRRIVCSGEALSPQAQRKVFARLPWAKLYNLYGPTEAAIDVTHWTCVEEVNDSVPIGRPIADTRTVILDDALNEVPPGVAGELYIGGIGLARGYLYRPGLTAERFVTDPFSDDGARLYRTGDLARWRADGQIEYLGRIDHQVKIRGFRIELGEIETQLLAQAEIREAVVVARDGAAGARLVAYVVPSNDHVDTAAVGERLAAVLPDYMVPTAFVVLEELPLNANGKLDRKALPDPQHASTVSYEAPRGVVEEALASAWREVLGVEQVGRHDNFFEAGGDSILSLQIVSRMRRGGWKITPRHLFERQTIALLAGVAERASAAVTSLEEKLSGDVPLLPIQAWFFEQQMPARHHWNQSVLLHSRESLDTDKLAQALAAVVDHHDALRLRYSQDAEGRWQQAYSETTSGTQELLWIRGGGDAQRIEAICNEAQRSLHLSDGPLLRAVAIGVADGSCRLFLAVHHLVVDGVSWRILLEDLQAAYRQALAGQPIQLPGKSSSSRRWARRLQRYASDHSAELSYWQRLADVPVHLPCDSPERGNLLSDQSSVAVRLDRDQTRALLKEVPAAYRTQINDVLLTALGRALCLWSGHERILVELEGHGREDLFEDIDLSRTVGWLTNLYPVVLDARGDPATALKRIKETLREVPNRGLGYGALRYLGTPAQREALAPVPASQVAFNYLGQFDGSFDEDALWKPAAESGGSSMDARAPGTHELTINGQVYDGELRLNVRFSRQRYRREHVQACVDSFKRELEVLIAHCTSGARGATPSDFPLASLTQVQIDALPIPNVSIEDLYSLTPMQQGLLFHSLHDADAATYVNQMRVDIGGLDVQRFRDAWRAVVERHEILRTGFLGTDDISLQWVSKDAAISVAEHDWRGQTDLPQKLDQLASSERAHPFDLASPPLMRLAVVWTRDAHCRFIWTYHHLLIDGWSTAQLMGEVLHHYNRQPLTPLRSRYRDYIHWLKSRDPEASAQYWKSQLRQLDSPTLLADAVGVEGEGVGHAEHLQVMDEVSSQRLIEFAKRERVTVNTLVQAAWAVVLSQYTGQESVVLGATTAGRPADLHGVEQMLGLFINTFPVIAICRPHLAVGDWLRELQAQNIASREHEHTPLYEIQKWAGVGAQGGLFDTLLVFENYPIDEVLRQPVERSLSFTRLQSRSGNHYPLTLRVQHAANVLKLHYLHDRSRVGSTSVQRLSDQFKAVLEQIVEASRTGELRLLADRSGLQGAATQGIQGVLEQFKVVVRRNAAAVSVTAENESLTFAELDERSTRLSHALRARGIGPEARVGIHADRSIEFVVGVLAVLKAGGVYVALDPQLPVERLRYQLVDSGARLLLAAEPVEWAASVPFLGLTEMPLVENAAEYPLPEPHPDQAAYVIYTSGSTGKPKGVVVTHGALGNYVRGVLDRLALPADATSMAMVSTVAADLGNTVLFGALCSGRALHLISTRCAFDPDGFAEYMRTRRVDVLKITPSHIQALLNAARPEDVLPRHTLIVGGEATSWALLARVNELRPALRVLNHYGPTETTVGVLTQDARDAARSARTLPIGAPLPNTHAHVLDKNLNPVPEGVAGELYLGGAGIARGYQQRAGLTAERFVADPFWPGERLYRTGDRVRVLPDSSIEFLGRLDHQIKIRGYRVELEEVASALKALSGARDVAVIPRTSENGRLQLDAYVVPDAGAVIDLERLKEEVSRTLPDYMVPNAIVALDALPLTANGKLDRKALPEPTAANADRFEPPQGELEATLASIWSNLLGVERVGRNDNFFALGGDSILALKFVARARQRSIALAPKQLFQHQTLAALAEALLDTSPAIPVVDRSRPLPLSHAQSRQWFLWQLDPHGTAYHITRSLKLQGRLDVGALKSAFVALVDRHESLRTVIRSSPEGVAEQHIQPPGQLDVRSTDLRGWPAETRHAQALKEAQRVTRTPFDLAAGPLFRIELLQLAEDEHVLVMVMHHIVSDGWSMQVIVDEFVELYCAHVERREPALKPLPIQYADYATWQREALRNGEHERQLAYWRAQLGEESPVLQLPTDRARAAEPRYRAVHHSFELSASLTEGLRQRAREQRSTLFALLLAGFQALLHRYTGQNDIRVGMTNANRSRPETQGVVGLFVNTQVLRAQIDGRMSLRALVEQVHESVARAQEHQDLPFEQLVEALQPERSLSHPPLFQVMMNHQRRDYRSLAYLPNLTLERFGLEGHGAQFELALNTTEYPDGRVGGLLTYAVELFEPETIARLGRHYLKLLEEIASRPQELVSQVALLGEPELEALGRWSSNDRRYTDVEPVHRVIERQVERTPSATALIFGDVELSYEALNQRANQLAHRLIALGVKPEVRVGLKLERSIEMVVGLLAVMKAGGAYVPFDPEYPQERLDYMMRDSGVELLLTRESIAAFDLVSESEDNPQVALHPESPAYVIYTSGSTGRPKGAVNRHRSLYNRLVWMQEAYTLAAADTVLQKTPFSFDVSVWEFFWPLMYGARLVLAGPGAHRDPEQLVTLIREHGVSTLHFVPSMLQAFLEHEGIEDCTSLRRIVCSGEALSVESKTKVFTKLPQAKLYNLYGPTEAAIDVTHWTCTDENRSTVPIGQPIADTRTVVLDGSLNLVPQGIAGELYLGGVGLARGYLSRSGLTAERFVADPFREGERLYRTGDLVRWSADGQLEYLGRIDHQIKIRGFRIELGEIESQLLAQPEVREAVVIAKGGPGSARGAGGAGSAGNASGAGSAGSARLVAYVVPTHSAIDTSLVRERLTSVLPDYMVPATITVLEEMPLNANGKLDRKRLPEPEFTVTQSFEAPVGELEEALATIWSEVLGIDRIGRHDNFFTLGGHSLLLLEVMSRAHRTGDPRLKLRVRDLMQNPTIANLANLANLGSTTDLSSRALVTLGPARSAEQRPLFCFHPGLGTAFNYLPLARRLADVRPVCGIVCRTHLDPAFRDHSIEQQAADYCQMIRSFQSHGPYSLLGWSSGGLLALLVAKLLEESGEEVDFVGLVDSHVPQLKRTEQPATPADEKWRRALAFFISMVAPTVDVSESLAAVTENPFDSPEALTRMLETVFAKNRDKLHEGYAAMTMEDLASLFITYRHSGEILARYVPTPLALKATPHCWWAIGKAEASRLRLREIVGNADSPWECDIDATHGAIIGSKAFLDSAVEVLAGEKGALKQSPLRDYQRPLRLTMKLRGSP